MSRIRRDAMDRAEAFLTRSLIRLGRSCGVRNVLMSGEASATDVDVCPWKNPNHGHGHGHFHGHDGGGGCAFRPDALARGCSWIPRGTTDQQHSTGQDAAPAPSPAPARFSASFDWSIWGSDADQLDVLLRSQAEKGRKEVCRCCWTGWLWRRTGAVGRN